MYYLLLYLENESEEEIAVDVNMQHNRNFLHSDNDEIESQSDANTQENNESVGMMGDTQGSGTTNGYSVNDIIIEDSEEERHHFDNVSLVDDEISETSRLNESEIPGRSDTFSQEQPPNIPNRRFQKFGRIILDDDSSNSSQTSKSTLSSSNTLSIIAALKKSHLQNSSQYSSSSGKSKGSSTTRPFRFGSSNTAQQNLDMYIANSRSTMSSSKFFKKADVIDNRSMSSVRQEEINNSQGMTNLIRCVAYYYKIFIF